MSRSLAHIEEIKNIHPINGKDRIVLAEVLGWTVIVQKSDFHLGDKVIYVEIDSVLPEKPEFEFLRSKNFRIKTMKMAGCLSQGICFPLSILPQDREYNIGDDVTDIIGITQYEPTMDDDKGVIQKDIKPTKHYPRFLMRWKWFRQLVLPKKQAKGFPDFISKSDETRIENALFYLNDKTPMVCTEKCEGQSGSFALKKIPKKFFWQKTKYEFIVCSRNIRLWKEDSSSYWTVANKYNIKQVLESLIGDNDFVAIQGECVGTGIQKNIYHIDGYDLYVFNLIYPSGRLGSLEAKKIIEEHGMKFVPIINESYVLPDTIDELRKYVHGNSALYPTLREGAVIRSLDGQRSFKCVDPEYLLKHNE